MKTGNFRRVFAYIKKHRALSVLCVVFALFVFVLVYYMFESGKTSWFCENVLGIEKGNGYPVSVVGSSVDKNNFQAIENNLYVVSNTAFLALNPSAYELSKHSHSFAKPVLKANKNHALIYHLGGTGAIIENKNRQKSEQTFQNRIFAGNINERGDYIVVTDSKGYRCEMTAFRSSGEEMFRYYFSDCYITNVAISSTGKTAAAAGICAQDGVLKTNLYLFDLSSETPQAVFEYSDTTMLSLQYLSNGSLVAVGDKLTSFVNTKKNTKNDYAYNKKRLSCFCVEPSLGAALSLTATSDERNCSVIVLSKSGQETLNLATDKKIESISLRKDIVAALSQGTITGYSTSGKELGSWPAGSEARAIALNLAKEAYVLGVGEIGKVQLK